MRPDSRFDVDAARCRLAVAYDPSVLHAVGDRLIALLSRHLRDIQRGDGPALNWAPPAELVAAARSALSAQPGDRPQGADQVERLSDLATELAAACLRHGNNLHHPRYVGHQVPASIPLAALFDLTGSVTNQVMAIYEMGPWATAVEQAVLSAVGEQLGFSPGTFAGLITSGGSLGNLTALLTARNVALGAAWTDGLCDSRPAPVLVTHAEAHYCVTRAAGILGLGTQQVVRVDLDPRRRMDPERLDATLETLRRRGVPVIAVSAAACATPIGAFDRLEAVADVCEKNGVWMHVDAAHGGAAAFSAHHRQLIAGIERADSVVCDAHKMMFMPALCALVFYRNKRHRLTAFHQDAPYLFDPSAPELADYDSGMATVECTKRAAALGLWGVWSMFGPQLFADLVDVTFEMGQRFYALLQAADDFQAPYQPECNIVVFRHVPPALRNAAAEQLDAFQLRLRRTVIESGAAYLVANRIDGRNYLRATTINPLTTEHDLADILDRIRSAAAALLADEG